MNPITENRYNLVRYAVLYTLFAAAYAAAFGLAAAMPAGVAVADGAVFALVSGFEGLILWSVLKYGTAGTPTANYFRIVRLSLLTAAGILFVAVSVGAETAAVWLASQTSAAVESPLRGFLPTIPARGLVTAVVYVCFVLWYSSAANFDRETEESAGPVEKPLEKPAGHPAGETRGPIERITVRGAGGRIEVIGVNDIVYIQAEGDYVAIVTQGGRWLKEGTMKWFEEALPRKLFVRVHRSFIVSVDHISRIETSGRDHTLVLREGSSPIGGGARGGGSIRISDAGYRLLKRTLGL